MADSSDKALAELQKTLLDFTGKKPDVVGVIAVMVIIDESGDPVYIVAGAPGPADLGHKWSPRTAEDALCEAIAWNRSAEEDLKREARAKAQGKAPTVEGTKAVN